MFDNFKFVNLPFERGGILFSKGFFYYLLLTPDDIIFGSNKKVWWTGTCGHEWKSVINARVKGTVCSVCADHLHKFEITQKLDF